MTGNLANNLITYFRVIRPVLSPWLVVVVVAPLMFGVTFLPLSTSPAAPGEDHSAFPFVFQIMLAMSCTFPAMFNVYIAEKGRAMLALPLGRRAIEDALWRTSSVVFPFMLTLCLFAATVLMKYRVPADALARTPTAILCFVVLATFFGAIYTWKNVWTLFALFASIAVTAVVMPIAADVRELDYRQCLWYVVGAGIWIWSARYRRTLFVEPMVLASKRAVRQLQLPATFNLAKRSHLVRFRHHPMSDWALFMVAVALCLTVVACALARFETAHIISILMFGGTPIFTFMALGSIYEWARALNTLPLGRMRFYVTCIAPFAGVHATFAFSAIVIGLADADFPLFMCLSFLVYSLGAGQAVLALTAIAPNKVVERFFLFAGGCFLFMPTFLPLVKTIPVDQPLDMYMFIASVCSIVLGPALLLRAIDTAAVFRRR